MNLLESLDGLVVSQQKEWGEILTNFETRNRYDVLAPDGRRVYEVTEEGGSSILRIFLKANRPFEIFARSMDGQLALRVDRPFRFFFHEASIYDGEGQCLGTIKRQFSLLRRIYTVTESGGSEAFQLFGPLLHPWTFHIRSGAQDCGVITKKWSGILKEGFSDADNFGITFPADWPIQRKALFLGTVFLIDFVHFENKGDERN